MAKYYTGLAFFVFLWTILAHFRDPGLVVRQVSKQPIARIDSSKKQQQIPVHNYKPSPKYIIAYLGGFRGLVQVDSIRSEKLTHINYAFADVKDNRVFLRREATDTINLRLLPGLKKRNPSLKLILSVGGWLWSGHFSDAALSDTSRAGFARSAAAAVQKFDLDGIDIDWEYPGQPGAGNPFRSEDKEHFTALLKEVRHALDSTGRIMGKHLILSIAAATDHYYLDRIEARKLSRYLDYFNLMSYDYKDEGDTLTGHHANLYSAPGSAAWSADSAVNAYLRDSVAAAKLVMGIAFYGRGYKIGSLAGDGLYQHASGDARAGAYDYIHDSLLPRPEYSREWDKEAHAPFLFNAKDSLFITYEDEQSVREKCRYTVKKQLAGVMFWEYFDDPENYLLNEIVTQLGKPNAGQKTSANQAPGKSGSATGLKQ